MILVKKIKSILGNIQDSMFLTGFSKWKDATRCFTMHESTTAHKAVTDLHVKIPPATGDVGELLSSAHTKEKASN